MEHIVQFAIGIDDQAIQKRIEENAYNDILDKLMDEAKNSLPQEGYVYVNRRVNWRHLVEEQLELFVERHKDEIIDAAAEKLCESYKRTKAFKEKMSEATDMKLKKQQELAARYEGAVFNGECD